MSRATSPVRMFLPMLLLLSGCQAATDAPATFVSDPRVLAIKAEPPEVAPGGTASVTLLIAGADNAAPVVSWSRCRRAPLPGQSINPDCLDNPQASYIEPIGEGPTITATMPADITPTALGQPDASGGVYLPLIARVTVGGDTLVAAYRWRLGPGTGGNRNPTITGVFVVDPAGPTMLDPAAPRVVHAGDRLTLGVAHADGSADVYVSPVNGASGAPVIETLNTSWFSSAGTISDSRTNDAQPNTVLSLDKELPAVGGLIDLYAVTHDERGGTDYVHRTMKTQ